MFTGFRERSLNSKRIEIPTAVHIEPKHRFPRWVVIAAIAVMIIIVGVVVSVNNTNNAKRTSDWPDDSLLQYNSYLQEYVQYGVHLSADNRIDKTYSPKELKKLSKQELTADNVVIFYEDSAWGPYGNEVAASTTMTVDGISYPFNTHVDVNIDPTETPIQTYNEVLAIDPSISLRGQKNLTSLTQYVLGNVTARLSDALKKGSITAPAVAYDGTGTEYHNDDVATAYKAGINANLFNSQCNQNSNSQNNPCSAGTATYDFGCKTVGVTYPNMGAFTVQVEKVLQLKNIYLSIPEQGQVHLNTTVPCRILLNRSTPPTPTPLPNEGGNN
jgi:hypothetical protein